MQWLVSTLYHALYKLHKLFCLTSKLEWSLNAVNAKYLAIGIICLHPRVHSNNQVSKNQHSE